MIHSGPVPGSYLIVWTKCNITNPQFCCIKCKSKDISFRKWESACGGYEDTHYRCDSCHFEWWMEQDDG